MKQHTAPTQSPDTQEEDERERVRGGFVRFDPPFSWPGGQSADEWARRPIQVDCVPTEQVARAIEKSDQWMQMSTGRSH